MSYSSTHYHTTSSFPLLPIRRDVVAPTMQIKGPVPCTECFENGFYLGFLLARRCLQKKNVYCLLPISYCLLPVTPRICELLARAARLRCCCTVLSSALANCGAVGPSWRANSSGRVGPSCCLIPLHSEMCDGPTLLVFKWPERRANCHSGAYPTQPSSTFDSPRRALLRAHSAWHAPARFAHLAARHGARSSVIFSVLRLLSTRPKNEERRTASTKSRPDFLRAARCERLCAAPK